MATQTERVVGQRYVLRNRLGRGGMGVVWRAEDLVLKRPVAVKEVQIPSALTDDERSKVEARVMREARTAARLSHPNVVTVFDVIHDEGGTFIVMDLVEAPSLDEVVRDEGAFQAERAASVGLDVLAALEAAHAEGIVHRDVKPANVLIPTNAPIKLGDFGIATVKGDPKLTLTGVVLGSPSYMAPEQAENGVSGPATDLWSLGATIYFAVEGRPPFDKGQPIPTLAAVVREDPPAMRRGGQLEDVVVALLAKDPEARPSAPELRAALESMLAPTPAVIDSPTAPYAQTSTEELASTPIEPATRRPTPQPGVVAPAPTTRRSRTGAWIAAAAAVFFLAAAALVLFFEARDDDPEARGTGRADGSSTSEGAVTVPRSWIEYQDEAVGYTISYPPGWEVVPIDDTRTDFNDPASGTYLRVDWTDTPGPSPEGAWEDYSQEFAATHEGYQEIRIEPTTYKGMDAAAWEWLYTEDGVPLHAIDLGFVTDDGSYGFALNFQTHAEDWASSQDTFEMFKEAFEPPTP